MIPLTISVLTWLAIAWAVTAVVWCLFVVIRGSLTGMNADPYE